MITLEDGEVISSADQAAAIVEGTAESTYIGVSKVISVRLPVVLATSVQALAHKSGKTRNAAVAMLLEVGLEEVRQRLSEDTLTELHSIEQELLRDAFDLNGEA